MRSIQVVVGLGLCASVAFGAMAEQVKPKSEPRNAQVQKVSMAKEDLRLTLAAVDMQRQVGGTLEFSERARKLLAQYGN